MRGARKLHRGVVTEELRRSIDQAVRSGAFSLRSLGVASGFPNPQLLSMQMNRDFASSTLNLERWRKVADICGYEGDPIVEREVASHG